MIVVGSCVYVFSVECVVCPEGHAVTMERTGKEHYVRALGGTFFVCLEGLS